MSQLTVKLSDRADALIAQLQKEIFNRRRKKVSAAGVIETLVESGAKSQSDKRFATSWKNLVSDIEKAAKVADAHGAKPANLSDEEWALVLSHRTRTPAKPAQRKPAQRKPVARQAAADKPATRKPRASKAVSAAAPSATAQPADTSAVAGKASTAKAKPARKSAAKRPARKAAARKPVAKSAESTSVSTQKATSSVARRMAKAVSRLSGAAAVVTAPSTNGAVKVPLSI
ncbi:MAG: hypothetical protein FJ077_02695 [Cyanobacteria bacterium K_DeepCast_35m_m2_023]|nr:hypothetical protein [Cyanobacteria bacterium K_DeepCast_35m_m2_023]